MTDKSIVNVRREKITLIMILTFIEDVYSALIFLYRMNQNDCNVQWNFCVGKSVLSSLANRVSKIFQSSSLSRYVPFPRDGIYKSGILYGVKYLPAGTIT